MTDEFITERIRPSHASQRNPSIQHLSPWNDIAGPIKTSSLKQDIKTDAVIVGAGIAGLSIARTLAMEGKRCVVIDRGNIGNGETGRTSAHLSTSLDSRYFNLLETRGAETTRLIAQSHSSAINHIEKIVRRENIDCNFKRVNGYLFLHPSDRIKSLQKEFEATRWAGLCTELISDTPGIRLKEAISLKFPWQAQFNPLKYLKGLCRTIERYGGRIYTNTQAIKIDREGVTTDQYRINANHVVVATHVPFNEHLRTHIKQFRSRTYVVAAQIPKGRLEPALLWDTGENDSCWSVCPYHYVRVQSFSATHDLLICGGEDHSISAKEIDGSEESERLINLEAWTRHHFPMVEDLAYRWSGEVMIPVDAIGYIGRNLGEQNVYIVSGGAGNGLTHGALAGTLIPDLIAKRKNPYEELYSLTRLPEQDEYSLHRAPVEQEV